MPGITRHALAWLAWRAYRGIVNRPSSRLIDVVSSVVYCSRSVNSASGLPQTIESGTLSQRCRSRRLGKNRLVSLF
jgi:hypothetical protein